MLKNRAGSKGTSINKNMRKKIRCPKCGSRFMDSSLSTVSEIRLLSENTDPAADYYMKCEVCGSELAVKKLG